MVHRNEGEVKSKLGMVGRFSRVLYSMCEFWCVIYFSLGGGNQSLRN